MTAKFRGQAASYRSLGGQASETDLGLPKVPRMFYLGTQTNFSKFYQ